MPRLSKVGAVRQMMQDYGRPQSVEAIQQYVEERTGGSTIGWPEIKAMLDDGELQVVDGGPNGKGGTLSLYGPGPQLQGAEPEPSEEDGEPVPA